MKQKLLTTAILVAPLCLATPLRAENPEHVRQLLQTKSCEGCDLRGADLSGANLSFAVLVGADLRRANLTRANLSQADLTRANLSQANFQGAILDRAYLSNANLEQTNFVGASLIGTRGLPIMNPPIANLPSLPRSLSPRLTRPVRPLPPLNIPPLPSLSQSIPLPQISKKPRSSRLLEPSITEERAVPKPIPAPQTTLPRQEANPPSQPSQQPANIYPPRLVQVFMDACTKEGNVGGINSEQVCTCSINKIQNEYTLEEFMNLSLDMIEKKNPPERIVQIAVECALENLSPRQEVSLAHP